jgi:SAM-dependent methyltransferase
MSWSAVRGLTARRLSHNMLVGAVSIKLKENGMQRRQFLAVLASAGAAGLVRAVEPSRQILAQASVHRSPDVIFVPTPNDAVDKMFELAQVGAKDVVYDLGCGDGRIVISAAQRFGARGVGIDIDPHRIVEATANIKSAGVGDKVRLIEGDLFEADISEATVVTLYLLTRLNVKLRPKLLKELKPGTRVVSHAFNMGDWAPEKKTLVGTTSVYLWRIPGHAS